MTALLSARTIARQFALNVVDHDPSVLQRLRCVQIAGARHGRAGYYQDGEFGSDADWCYGVGAEITALEEILDCTDEVFRLYTDAHSAFYRDGTINPGDRPGHGREKCFNFQFSNGCGNMPGVTYVSVWARGVEDALELAAEWLADHAPGLFTEPDYADAAAELGVAVPFTGKDLGDLYRAGEDELAQKIEDVACADLTYTESGYLASWEWSVSESDTPPGPPGK